MGKESDPIMNMSLLEKDINRLARRNQRFYSNEKAFHKVMQADVVKLASVYGLKGQKDYEAKSGVIDVVWLNGSGELVLAVEIDYCIESCPKNKFSSLPGKVDRLWICFTVDKVDLSQYEKIINGSVLKYEFEFQVKR